MDVIKLRGIAAQMLFKHKLTGWTFALENTGRRLGVCKHSKSHIGISEHHARNSPEKNVMDTLLHELAHAIVGQGHGHDAVWKAKAIELGAKPYSCDKCQGTEAKPGDWQAKCPSCQRTHHKYRKPKRLDGWRCKCPARCLINFAYAGNPALKPREPAAAATVASTVTVAGHWQVTCPACHTTHKLPSKPPNNGKCRCAMRCRLPDWRFVPRS